MSWPQYEGSPAPGISEGVTVSGSGSGNNLASVAGGAGLFGGAFQALSSPFLQKWSQDYARHEAGKAWERSMESWREQNEYNLPKNYMKRLEDAGINPHLAFAKGGMPTAATGAPSGQKAAQPDFKWDFSGLMAGMEMLEKYQDVKIKQQQAAYAQPYNQYKTMGMLKNLGKIDEQIDLIIAQTENESHKAVLTHFQSLIRQAEAGYAQEGFIPGYDSAVGRIIKGMEEGERQLLLNILGGIDGVINRAGKGAGIYQSIRRGGRK